MGQLDERAAGNAGASTVPDFRAATHANGKPLIAVYGATSKQGRSHH
jgi:hypothetical protein